MDKKEIQFELLKTELELTQRQMDKYDQLSTSVKAWSITLWAASVGWALNQAHKEMFLLGALIVAIFWFFDAFNKVFRQDYKSRRDEVGKILATFFKTGAVPENVISPQLPTHSIKNIFKHFFLIHLALPYFILIAISLILALT